MADKNRTTLKGMSTPEHTKIFSRTRGIMLEIAVGPHGTSDKDNVTGGLVSKNPFASAAQRGYLHANPGVLGSKALKEWDRASKGQHVPRRVRKAK